MNKEYWDEVFKTLYGRNTLIRVNQLRLLLLNGFVGLLTNTFHK